eukprot:m51a1_g1396 hypothetical protein (333) ;mRNA; f:484677-485795
MEQPLHSRVVPDSLHTLDDLVFASFQGPVLSLSSRVLHQYRAFAALLLLRTRWRTDRGLSRVDVAAALLMARPCKPGSLEAVQCRVCEGVLEVSENVVDQERLRRELPRGVELYAVTVRTRCTSSRKHVGSTMLVLAADVAPGVTVVSDRFAIYARHAARHAAKLAREADGCKQLSLRTQRLEARVRSPSADASSPGALSSPSSSSVDEVYVWGALVTGPPVWADLRALSPQGMAIGVRINIIRCSPDEQQQISSAIVPTIRSHVPGYLVHKTSRASASLIIIVYGASTLEGLMTANTVGVQFLQNEIRNPFNRDLVRDGIVQPIVVVSNMG